jgi:hypothetical protein
MRHIASLGIAGLLRADEEEKNKPVLDSTNDKADEEKKEEEEKKEPEDKKTEPEDKKEDDAEAVMDAAGEYTANDIALNAVAAVQEWAETVPSDLDEGEGLGDRLFGLLVGIADEDMDGDISEDEAEVVNMAAEIAAEYLISKGVSEADVIALLEDFDNDLAANVQEFVVEKMPEGDDSDLFVFGDGSDESALDAVYKKKIVVRAGRKVRINKRVSGFVKRTTGQKLALKKALRKAHSATAKLRRAKSMRRRKSM